MANFPFDLVMFDLDGTLVDSALDLSHAVNHALAGIDREPVEPEKTRTMIGGGTDMMLTKALEATGGLVDQATFARLSQRLLEHYWAHIADHTRPYPGCLDALDMLADHGCKLAVCTNKAEKPARDLIEALGMTSRFAVIYGGDTLGRERAKPRGDMLRAAMADCGVDHGVGGRGAMMGDSTFDVRAARDAGVPVVTYRHGFNDVPVEELGGDVLIDHFDELVDALHKLGAR